MNFFSFSKFWLLIALFVCEVSFSRNSSLSVSKEDLPGWEFELPKGRQGYNEGTAEVSGACLDGNGSLWSIGDGGLNGEKLTKSSFHSDGSLKSQEIYHITSFNRDMEWAVCDPDNNTLIIGDTGDNNLERGTSLAPITSKLNEDRKHLERFQQPHNLTHNAGRKPTTPRERRQQLAHWERQLEKSWRETQEFLLKKREARIYVYSLDEDKINNGYDGKKFLTRLGFVKLSYQGGPMDVEAAVIKNEDNGDRMLYLFEKTNPFFGSHFAKMLKLNLSRNLSINRELKTAVPKVRPEEVQHIDFRKFNHSISYITDATLSSNQDTLYLLTDDAIVRYADWTTPSSLKQGQLRSLPDIFSNLQLESITLIPGTSAPGKIFLGSDLLNAFVSLNEKEPHFWVPFFFSTEKKVQKKSNDLFL